MVQREQQACSQNIEVHEEFRSLVPPLTPEEFSQLECSILAEGCRDALVTWNGILLDGHNRLRICETHDIQFKTVEIDLPDEGATEEWIIRNQFGRRNLAPYQRVELVLLLEDIISARAKQKQREAGGAVPQKSAEPPIDTREELAKAAGVSHDTIAKAKVIHDKGTEEQHERLRRGETTIHREYTRIRLEEKHEAWKQMKAPDPLEGKYNVVVVDPPWPMKKMLTDSSAEEPGLDYQTMSLEEIEELAIPAADHCHLFCWTTQTFLPAALRIIERWGFRYVLTMVWHKPAGMQPFGLPQYNCEFVIYARKGSPVFVDTKGFSTCFEAPRGKHSEKPERFYETLRRVTAGTRVDVFSRRHIDGFDVWGNEV